MADDTRLNAPLTLGDLIRTDEISGVKFPVSKIALGASGVDEGLLTATQLLTPLARVDIALSALRDALQGGGTGTLEALRLLLTAIDGHVDGLEALLAGTLAVSAAALPLPAGAATSAKQDALAALLPPALAASGGLKTEPVAALSATCAHSAAYEASRVVKASAGKLLSLIGYNSKASAQFIQIHDAASLPADTAVPLLTFTVPASSNFSLDVPLSGLPCLTGIVVCNSSTGPTKTVGSADVFFTAVYL